MGYVADRWHKSRPRADEPECGEHKGKVASSVHGQGKRWQARYDDPDGRERTSLHKTQAEAEQEIVKQEGAKLSGSWLDPKAGKISVEDFALEVWLPAQDICGRSEVQYRGVLDRYIIPEWGRRQIRSVRPSQAGAWQKLLTSKYELMGSTAAQVARRARSVFRLAVTDRVIAVSPFDGIKAPSPAQTAVYPPDIAEVAELIAHAYHDRWAVMTELAALTGLRSGELRGLQLAKLDLLRKALHVHRQLVFERGRGRYLDDVKTDAGRRTVPLNDRAVTLLARYVEKYPPPAAGPWAGLVFTMPDGKPVGESTASDALKSICRRAGVAPRHWHELRHHYASVLIAGGENPKVVQKRLGHADVAMTLRIYAHLWAEAEEQTRSVLDDAWATARGRQGAAESSPAGGRIPESRRGDHELSLVRE